jgi:threonine dehydratase
MLTPTIDDIHAAAERLKGRAVRTPLLESPVLNERLGGRVFLKAETLQRTGSFKFRGAYNRISQLAGGEFPGGIVACSSGNHAQGVGEAARLFGMRAVIVMPSDAPKVKIEGTRRSGADIVFYDRETEDRNAIAETLCEKLNAAFVPPFDDRQVMAGQGTSGLEIAAEMRDAGLDLDAVLVPTSGGGLVAGVAIAVHSVFPKAAVYCVEPADFNDYQRSLEAGERQRNTANGGSICDALLVAEPGKLTFAVNRHRLAGGLAASDAEVRSAMAFAYRELKLVVEPGGAVALAAMLAGRFPATGRNVAVVLSGGNVDPQIFTEIIAREH